MFARQLKKIDPKLVLHSLALLIFVNYFISGINIYFAILLNVIILLPFIVYRTNQHYGTRVKNYIANLSLVFITILVLIISAEVLLHIQKHRFLDLSRSIRGEFTDFTLRGYLDETVFNKAKGIFRILGLGDSFAVNQRWINKNYHNFLQNRFDKEYGPNKIEVINAGIEATGPGYYWNTVKKYGALLKPDLIIVGFFLGNDFEELNFDKVQIGWFIRESRDTQARLLGYSRLRNYWLYQVIYKKLYYLLNQRKRDEELITGQVKQKGSFSKDNFLKLEGKRLWIFNKSNRRELAKLCNKACQVMLNLKNWCDQRKLDLIVVLFPDQLQVEQDLRQEVLSRFNIPEDAIDINYPNKLLANYFKPNKIHCLDLLTQFQTQARVKKLYLTRDTHWNEAGNALTANIIFDYLQKNKLIRLN